MRFSLLICKLTILTIVLLGCKEEEDKKNYQIFEVYSPQLELTKTIWLYLPADYHSSEKEYPVIYMQDAQWIFEKPPGYSQEMHVDENLRALEKEGFPGVIVVGIQSDDNTRADEFALYVNPNLRNTGGKGAQFLDFMVNSLKPRIDSLYRTKTGPENTALMGASLGGLATFYGMTEYPEVYGKGAMFSAAVHFNADSIFKKAAQKLIPTTSKIFGVVGASEVNEQVNFPRDNEILFSTLKRYMPQENVLFEIHEDGEHRIWFYEREFPKAVLFLFN